MKSSQVFIASFWKDVEWLRHNLITLKKFSEGFLPPVVCVTVQDYPIFKDVVAQSYPGAILATHNGVGFMGAQVAMMMCDIYCPDADYIFLLGSDCMAVDKFTPAPFFDESGLPVMLYNTFDHLLKFHPGVMPWKTGTERVLGFECPVETMRRIPIVYPRELYAHVRSHIERLHGQTFSEYIHEADRPRGDTSESNILGGYAHRFMPHLFRWWNMDENYNESVARWPSSILQFWSKAANGMDSPCDRDFKYSGGTTLGKTPRQVFKEVMGE